MGAGANSNLTREVPFIGRRQTEAERELAIEVDDFRQIHSLSLRLASATSLSEVMIDVLHTAAALLDAELGSAQLITESGELAMVGQLGFGETVLTDFSIVSLADCSTCAVALKRKSRAAVSNLRTDPEFSDIAAALRAYGAVGAVSTPVIDRAHHVLAMFSVYWREAHELTERDERVLDLCAELAGRHVERSAAAKALRDVEEKFQARQALLMGELAHRGKNLLAVIQAIASRSLSGERTLSEARDIFIGRLRALGTSYNTLTEQSPDSVQLKDIVSACLETHSERVTFRGPDVFVPAKSAQTLGLVFHELATNASKYGSLSTDGGRVAISWKMTKREDGSDRFSLEWREFGGPPIQRPSRIGFGSSILTSVVGKELNCEPKLDYAGEGLLYAFDCRAFASV